MGVLVLVHGGGHGGWCWKTCAQVLRAGGHEVYTPTLTGCGERRHLVAPGFETWVDDVANVIDFEDLDEVILVGHSMGGVIIPRVAERMPARIGTVVWLAAVVTADGESLLQATPQSRWIARAVKLGADGTAHTDPELILEANIQDGTPEQRELVRRKHCAYPPYALVEPGRLSAFLALGLPTGYVTATRDRTIEPELCEKFAARLPGCRRASVDAGHDCMITQPEATARALLEVSGRRT
ncbi:MAG TPA: alpha/beta hydrolase [Myxococcota bacterium]|nr:alpha/beta hydrolase [Myxococcota bacterium]